MYIQMQSNVRISKLRGISVPENCFYHVANSVDHDEMPLYAAFQLIFVVCKVQVTFSCLQRINK